MMSSKLSGNGMNLCPFPGGKKSPRVYFFVQSSMPIYPPSTHG